MPHRPDVEGMVIEDVPMAPGTGGGGGGRRGVGGGGTERKANIQGWRGTRMVRRHSFLACIEQIVTWASEIDVTRVGIIGDMGSGKTTLAQAIAHACHARAKQKYGTPYAVRLLQREQLLDFKRTLAELPAANYVLTFDDSSFLNASANRREIVKVREAVTTIRHMADRAGRRRDVKIIMLIVYHYSKGLDKYLRQSDFRFWMSVGTSEVDALEREVGPRGMAVVKEFQRQCVAAVGTRQWSARVGKDGRHMYRYRDPWIPVLFADATRIRPVVDPTRQCLAPRCPTCAVSDAAPDEIEPGKFASIGRRTLGTATYAAALKLVASENGMPAHSRRVLGAKRAIEEALAQRHVSLEQLLLTEGIEPVRTRRRSAQARFVAAVRAAPGRPPAATAKAAAGRKS